MEVVVDRSLLYPREIEILDRLTRCAAERDESALPRKLRGWASPSPSFVFACVGFAVAAFWWVGAGTGGGRAFDDLVRGSGVAAIVVLSVGLVFHAVRRIQQLRAWRRLVPSFLEQIRYRERVERGSRRAISGGSRDSDERAYYTGGYDPGRWFSYGASERQYMQMMDMDADTYDSNVRERD